MTSRQPADVYSASHSTNKSVSANLRLTKRAPDAGESAAISGSFLRLSLFLAGRLRRPRPSAGNANRWADRTNLHS